MNVHFRRQVRWRRMRRKHRHIATDGNTTAKKDAITINTVNVAIRTADAHTSVERVGVPNPITGAPTVIRAHPILHYDALESGLSSHPDRAFVARLLEYTRHGVPIGYKGLRSPRECSNWPSLEPFSDEISRIINNDVHLGRKAGPFQYPPFDNFVGSPMGAFSKRSGKIRLIHDLSWPPGESVNDHISPEEYSLQYMSMDDLVQRITSYGTGTLLGKLDIADAFKHILVRSRDWDLLGSTYYNLETHQKQYYVDLVLPFGLRSSPKLFNEYADALQFIMLKNGVSECMHYMDDYVTLGPKNSTQCRNNLEIMQKVCDDIGFSINPNKLVLPNTVIEFIGFIVDTNNMELRISENRLRDIIAELTLWEGRKTCKKRELLSIIGKLIFVSKVVRSGRTFVRRLIDLSRKVKYLHHRVNLNLSARKDIQWWLAYLPSWNGITMLYDSVWTTNQQLELYTDSSDIAIGAYFNDAWFYEVLDDKLRNMSINWRELYAIVIAITTWGKQLASKRLLIYCDNLSICYILQKGTSKSEIIMDLVRQLFYICAQYNIELSAKYVSTVNNGIADSLSRLQFNRFRSLAPCANTFMTLPIHADSYCTLYV